MRDALQYLQNAGFVLYLVPYLWFGLVSLRHKADSTAATTSARRFLSMGPLLGLSLGACIFGALAGIWLGHGEFSWANASTVEITLQLVFGITWVSNIKFEVWTLEPSRKKLASGAAAIGPELSRARRHLWVHCILLIAVVGLSQQS